MIDFFTNLDDLWGTDMQYAFRSTVSPGSEEAVGEAVVAYRGTPYESLKNVSPYDIYVGKGG